MKNTFLSLIVCLLLAIASLHAQQTYPIYVTPSLTPSYSLTLSDYSQPGSQRLVVTIMVRDVTVTNLPVRLHLKMETMTGVTIETIPTAPVVPIFLSGGETALLFGDDMKEYFNISNLQFKGYSKDEYRRTGQLPEGFYRFTVEVRHFATGKLISNQGTAMAWMALGKPPVLKTPSNNAELGQIQGMPLTFAWLPSNAVSPNSGIQYTFELWEMRVPGINPNVVAASMPVFYRATQMNTTLQVYPVELMLEPGLNYAWRVTASDVMGQVPFAQGGHSEVRSFVYQCRCDSITNFTVERKGEYVTYRWTPADNHSSYNVEIENPVSGWSKSERVFDTKYEFRSDPDKTYRARVQAICQGNEQNPSEHSSWRTVTIPAPKTQAEICPRCECGDTGPEPIPENQTLKLDLHAGDTIFLPSRNFIFVIDNITQNNSGTYKGQFDYLVNIWGGKFFCNFGDLQVNTDYEILNHNFESVFDPAFLVDVGATKEYINNVLDAAAILSTNFTIKDTVQVNASLEGAYINSQGQLVTVTQDASGKLNETIQTLPGKPDGTLVQGSNGEEYVLTSDGKIMGKEEFKETGGNSRLMDNYNKEREEKAQPRVTFSASPNQTYGFDAYESNSEIRSNIAEEYPELKAGYRPAFKSVEVDKTDKVQVNGDAHISYRTEYGVPVSRSGNELIIRGDNKEGETILYAYGKQGSDTTEVIVGKLNILTMKEKTEKVCLVSINGANLPNTADLEKELTWIYAPAVTKWEVSTCQALTDIKFAGEQMTHGGSGLLTMYNADQKTIINAFKKKIKNYDNETSYLFFVNNVQSKDKDGVTGYMPIQYQYGFIYDSKDYSDKETARNIAHELGHGVFHLPHTFDKPILKEQGATDNLMDYNQKMELWKHQWKLIQNPKNLLLKFLQDEEEGEGAKSSGTPYMKIADTEIKNNGDVVIYNGTSKKIEVKYTLPKASTAKVLFKLKVEIKSTNKIMSYPKDTKIEYDTLIAGNITTIELDSLPQGKYTLTFKQGDNQTTLYALKIKEKFEVTKEQLKAVFPNTDNARIEAVVNAINSYGEEFGICTSERLAHFIGQIGAETGGLKQLKEDCNYTAKNIFDNFLKPNLINSTSSSTGQTFKYCDLIENINHGSLNTCPYNGGCDSIVSVKFKKDNKGNNICAWEYTYFDSLYTIKSNYIKSCELFDYVYGCRMGNGIKSTKDGSTFKGKGFIHLTGKGMYKDVSNEWNRLYPNDKKEFHGKDINLLETDIEVAIKASMVYWKIKGLNVEVDNGLTTDNINKVGGIVNGKNPPNGEAQRKKYTNDIYTQFNK